MILTLTVLTVMSREKKTVDGQLAEEEEDVLKEAFFSPSDGEMLQALFDAFSHAAELNPEEEEGDGDEEGVGGGDGGLVFDHGR